MAMGLVLVLPLAMEKAISLTRMRLLAMLRPGT